MVLTQEPLPQVEIPVPRAALPRTRPCPRGCGGLAFLRWRQSTRGRKDGHRSAPRYVCRDCGAFEYAPTWAPAAVASRSEVAISCGHRGRVPDGTDPTGMFWRARCPDCGARGLEPLPTDPRVLRLARRA